MVKGTTWFSNGNLIISGEYFVLTGAKALAVPLKYGQKMNVECPENQSNTIVWKSNEYGKQWFEADIECENLKILNSSDLKTAQRLQDILKQVNCLKPDLFTKKLSYRITCDTNFRSDWGWGTSSSLISNLANWSGIDPFELHKLVSRGSGYDIAASISSSPIFYQVQNGRREIKPAPFNPVFKKFIHFVFLGKKQNSEISLSEKLQYVKNKSNLISEITKLTEMIAVEDNIDEFTRIIAEHENILAGTLRMKRIKEEYFNDFDGELKSLGAWGGDCALIVSHLRETEIRRYFKRKGLETLFSFNEIVKLN